MPEEVSTVARLRTSIERAAALHRQATAAADAAERDLDRQCPEKVDADAAQRGIVADLASAAARLVPGWLGAPLDVAPPAVPGAGAQRPTHVRIGVARPLDDAEFPVIVPTGGHLAIDAEPADDRAIGLLRSVLLRLVAAHPAGTVRVRAIDRSGTALVAFQALIPAGLMREPAINDVGLRAVLSEAEQWVRQPSRRYALLLVIASLPGSVDDSDLARIAALAEQAPGTGLQLIVAGWPAGAPPLPYRTLVSLRRRYPLVTDPPGGSFGASGSLDVPVVPDPDPPAAIVRSVCERIAAHTESGGPALTELLPDQLWQESSADGLAVIIGRAGGNPLTLRLSDLTPHWMVGGREKSGKTTFIVNVLYGLSTRYGPDQLTLYLLDFSGGAGFEEFVPTGGEPSWLPHARAVCVEADRDYGRAVLRELETELADRAGRCEDAGVDRFADLRKGTELPRIVCVIDEFPALLRGNDALARECFALVESLVRRGRSYGIHLVLASESARTVESLYAKRDAGAGQFPVRIALPGGSDALDPLNQAADQLGLGEAIVNTAGGLGGPAGASRAHERRVEFPDPYAEPEIPATVRYKLWEKRPDDRSPWVFRAGTRAQLPAVLPVTTVRSVYLGRRIDVPLSLADFPLEDTPGRHLAVLGPSELGADLLDAAARSLAAQHRPGTAHFVIAPFVAAVEPLTSRLTADLTEAGHQVTVSTSPQCPERDGYLFGFGLDSAPGQAVPDLPDVLRNGPKRGIHVFGWWRGLRRFAEDTGGQAAPADVAGLALLNVPAADAAVLLGDPNLGWQPRPNRALLHDRDTGRTEVIIPFAQPGRPA
ncbi:FtsK/SpoIIIE domain-containing protein [Rugosimonospora africana]|uniref:Cell division protein FtsK n=1 Tax=Rugosimonospora africana TaxID=556532 RepID=A0A8J3QYF8_9ACTN|nr:FtsK/SpoIIIE domain-containing protein [Rugosimonospora africana]GIH18173.1 cell division protein FtsK [Rugosimonospora africana]